MTEEQTRQKEVQGFIGARQSSNVKLFSEIVENQAGTAQHSGLCEGPGESLLLPFLPSLPPGLLFHSSAEYKELRTWALNTRLVPSTFHQVATVSLWGCSRVSWIVAAGESRSPD